MLPHERFLHITMTCSILNFNKKKRNKNIETVKTKQYTSTGSEHVTEICTYVFHEGAFSRAVVVECRSQKTLGKLYRSF